MQLRLPERVLHRGEVPTVEDTSICEKLGTGCQECQSVFLWSCNKLPISITNVPAFMFYYLRLACSWSVCCRPRLWYSQFRLHLSALFSFARPIIPILVYQLDKCIEFLRSCQGLKPEFQVKHRLQKIKFFEMAPCCCSRSDSACYITLPSAIVPEQRAPPTTVPSSDARAHDWCHNENAQRIDNSLR
jgi:hypothetical protein